MSKNEVYWMRDNFRKSKTAGRAFVDAFNDLDAGVFVRGFDSVEDLPKIAFYFRDINSWVACDNRNGRAWINEFERESDAIAFCNGR